MRRLCALLERLQSICLHPKSSEFDRCSSIRCGGIAQAVHQFGHRFDAVFHGSALALLQWDLLQHAQVCNLSALEEQALNSLLAKTEVGEVWGVGRRIGTQLQQAGVKTVLDLKMLDPATVRRRWSLVLERTVRELQGMPCIGFDEEPAAKKEIACTHSFGQSVTELSDLQQAITEFSSRAAEKLRRQGSHTGQVLCFIRTSPFRVQDEQYSRSIVMPLRRPTDDSTDITQAALRGLQALYQPGYRYAKAGVLLIDLSPADRCQHELALEPESQSSEREKLMKPLDAINRRYGRGTLQLASAGLEGDCRLWSMRQERRTPEYTTRWDDLALARA